MLSVPEALPNDPEGVVTALEAAQIFGQQGDIKEAVRWVRRAAEIAGDEGSDERALTLARAVADLNISASQPPQQPPPQAEPPAAEPAPTEPAAEAATAEAEAQQAEPREATAEEPPPPPLPGTATPTYDPDGDAETRVVESANVLADYQRHSNGNGAGRAMPTPALSPVATPVATPAEMVTPRAPQTFHDEVPPPPPPIPSQTVVDTAPVDTAPDATSAVEAPEVPAHVHVGSMAELLARKEAEVSSARAAADATEATDGRWEDPPPPPQPSVPPVERRTAHPAAERVATPLIPSQPYLERPRVNAPIYQAVRGSIVATAEPGVFVLRVLTAEQAPAPVGHEVLVVVTNPEASPFK